MLPYLWLVFTFGALYLLVVRPQRRRLAEHQRLMAALVIGDDVVTAGGLYGRIDDLEDAGDPDDLPGTEE